MPGPDERLGARWLGRSRLTRWLLAAVGGTYIGALARRRRRPVGTEVPSAAPAAPTTHTAPSEPHGTQSRKPRHGAAHPPRFIGLEAHVGDPVTPGPEQSRTPGGDLPEALDTSAAMSNLPAMPDPEEREKRHWLRNRAFMRWLLAGASVVVIAVIAVLIFVLVHAPHDVSHPNLSFTATTATTATTTTTQAQVGARDDFAWPQYGYTATRTRDFTAEPDLHPPFRRGWTIRGLALLEFPPVIFSHSLFFMADNGIVRAVDSRTGKLRWQRSVGTLSSESPGLAIRQKILVVSTLSDRGSTPGDGQVVALSMRTGREIWHHPLSPGSESSPLVSRNTVFYADQDGRVYSANVVTGRINWTFQASGAVKGGAAMSGHNLYVDDYGGHVYDINAGTGRQIWSASADGGELGFSSGTFYSTPTVAFGRVYVGNTSGYVYSFAASTGQLAWSHGTGAYVYSSAAVADVPGLGPTVFMGSYNDDLYAFNAQSGAVRWVHRDAKDDRISGSATVVNGVVYYSDLDDKLTTGLDAKTGRTDFTFHDGAFSPVVADPSHIYLSGGYSLYELLPAHASGSTPGRRSTHARQRSAGPRRPHRHSGRRSTPTRRATAATRTAAAKRAGSRHQTPASRRAAAKRHAAATHKRR